MNTETITGTANTKTAITAPAAATATQVRWYRPTIDVFETPSALVLLLDLPGVAPSAIDVQTEDNRLTIEGLRTDGQRGWRRILTLPPSYDPSKIEAKADNGVLTVTIAKSEAARPRKIDVR